MQLKNAECERVRWVILRTQFNYLLLCRESSWRLFMRSIVRSSHTFSCPVSIVGETEIGKEIIISCAAKERLVLVLGTSHKCVSYSNQCMRDQSRRRSARLLAGPSKMPKTASLPLLSLFIYLFRFSANTEQPRGKGKNGRTDARTNRPDKRKKKKKYWWRIIAAHHHKYHAGCKRFFSSFLFLLCFAFFVCPTYARRAHTIRVCMHWAQDDFDFDESVRIFVWDREHCAASTCLLIISENLNWCDWILRWFRSKRLARAIWVRICPKCKKENREMPDKNAVATVWAKWTG